MYAVVPYFYASWLSEIWKGQLTDVCLRPYSTSASSIKQTVYIRPVVGTVIVQLDDGVH